jgi:hypothetical protein
LSEKVLILPPTCLDQYGVQPASNLLCKKLNQPILVHIHGMFGPPVDDLNKFARVIDVVAADESSNKTGRGRATHCPSINPKLMWLKNGVVVVRQFTQNRRKSWTSSFHTNYGTPQPH